MDDTKVIHRLLLRLFTVAAFPPTCFNAKAVLNAYAVAGTAAADIPKWDFGFIKVDMIGYQAQVIPAMLAAFTLVYIEKFFRKYTPQVISMIVVPFFSLVLSVMAAHFILGPIGWKIGADISAGVY